MWISFSSTDTKVEVKYDGKVDARENIQCSTSVWKEIMEREWLHGFIHTLETIPMNWYLETKLRHGSVNWTDSVDGFILTFIFEYDCSCLDLDLQVIKAKIF